MRSKDKKEIIIYIFAILVFSNIFSSSSFNSIQNISGVPYSSDSVEIYDDYGVILEEQKNQILFNSETIDRISDNILTEFSANEFFKYQTIHFKIEFTSFFTNFRINLFNF